MTNDQNGLGHGDSVIGHSEIFEEFVTLPRKSSILFPVSSLSPRPPRSRQQWLLSLLLFSSLVLLSLYYLTNPQRLADEQFANAKEVPISEEIGRAHV